MWQCKERTDVALLKISMTVLVNQFDQKNNKGTYPEHVRLCGGGVGTRPLPVDLVLDARHGDKSGNNSSPLASLECSGNSAVVNVTRAADARAAVVLRQQESELAAGLVRVHNVASVNDPIVRTRVAVEQRGIGEYPRVVGEAVCGTNTERSRRARVEGIG